MQDKNTPLREQLEEESARLRQFWERYKASYEATEGRALTQAEFVERHLDFNVANFGHLLNGRVLARLETLFELAILWGFDPREVRPSIQAHIDTVLKSIQGNDASLVSGYINRLSPEQRTGVIDFARFLAADQKDPDS